MIGNDVFVLSKTGNNTSLNIERLKKKINDPGLFRFSSENTDVVYVVADIQ